MGFANKQLRKRNTECIDRFCEKHNVDPGKVKMFGHKFEDFTPEDIARMDRKQTAEVYQRLKSKIEELAKPKELRIYNA